ncbi:MAG: (deoxy)nucleoside triphosphate pyrophosphohydrolase [Clostridiaceae bacterium]|nr:(deoxy)nucleoside triphosphate pyrophosphohydrolase [Clostridiaceae bacterium]
MIEVVAAILINENKEIMIARKKTGKPLSGLWEFPGGKIEERETPEESLKREIMEEMNLTIEILNYFATNIHDYGDKKIKLIAYMAKVVDGKLKLKDHDKVEWVESQNLHRYQFAPADVDFVKILMEKE